MSDLQEMHDLVVREPLTRTRPDVASLIRRGRRVQLRRRAAYGAFGVAAVTTAVAALGSPHGQSQSTRVGPADGASHTTATTSPHPSHPRSVNPADICPETGGIFLCERPPLEGHIPVGDVVPIGHRTDAGDVEVLYAVQQRGSDLRTGTPANIVSVHAGLLRDDGLRGDAIGLQPGFGPDLPIPMTGGTQAGRYAIAGAVPDGTYDAITWTTPTGRPTRSPA